MRKSTQSSSWFGAAIVALFTLILVGGMLLAPCAKEGPALTRARADVRAIERENARDAKIEKLLHRQVQANH